MTRDIILIATFLAAATLSSATDAQDAAALVAKQQRFDELARQPTGLLIPLYLYPANIHTNAVYNRLIDLKKSRPRVPVWVILNPATGPGTQVDANYTKAIDRLRGAGIVVLGYVSTEYGKRPALAMHQDLDAWRKLYPQIQGAFFDEMLYEDTPAAAARQRQLRDAATARGFWPTVANPGAPTPERFFAQEVADVIMVHEGGEYPTEASLKGDYFGGYADYPPWMRCVLVHTRPQFEPDRFALLKKHVRWAYVTDDVFRDAKTDNPWDSLSAYLDQLFAALDS
ncbi:MAG TPA: spherulation-specific family 4 protein [Planctomycetaceae bacterium]|nr:spherulation-specific family 4 protein [Planctomycetaceae bacterium]